MASKTTLTSFNSSDIHADFYYNNTLINKGGSFNLTPVNNTIIIELRCHTGYSFNPENSVTPVINPRGNITTYIDYIGTTTEWQDIPVTYNDDYTIASLSFVKGASDIYENWYGWTSKVNFYATGFKATPSIETVSLNQTLTNCSSDYNSNVIEKGSNFTETITANDGYFLENVTANIGSVVISDDKTTATITVNNISDNLTVNAIAKKPQVTITSDISNCTIEYVSGWNGENTVDKGTEIVISFKAMNDCTFKSQPYVIIGTEKKETTGDNETYKTLIFTATDNCNIVAKASNPTKLYTITQNGSNITSDCTLTKVEENTEIVINYTAKNGYSISSLTANIGTVVISDDRLTATLTVTVSENLTVTATTEKLHTVTISGSFINATCNYSNGDILSSEKPIIITANSGYEFTGVYTYKNKDTYITSSMDNNGTTLTCDSDANIILNDEYKATKIVEKIGNFANLYYTNENELTELSKVRFVSDSSTTVDYGNFITALYKLPFPIDSGMLAEEKSNIILGNYDSNVESTRLMTYKTEIDGGIISVPEKYKNVYDYLNTECILHLPHFNKMYINTEYVIGQTLTIKYIIDLYTGNVTANVYSSFIDDIIETQTQQIAENIPFIQKQNNSIVGTVSNINKNAITTAFIEIVRNIPYDNENIFGKETIDYCVIGTKTGYIKVSDVVLNCTATVEEKEEIEQLLKEGVFINEH